MKHNCPQCGCQFSEAVIWERVVDDFEEEAAREGLSSRSDAVEIEAAQIDKTVFRSLLRMHAYQAFDDFEKRKAADPGSDPRRHFVEACVNAMDYAAIKAVERTVDGLFKLTGTPRS